MTEARIERLDAEAARTAAVEHGLPEYMADLSVFQIALRNPRVAKALNGMLLNLLIRGEFDGRLRELIIMRIGWSTGAVYEWTQHWRVAIGMEIADQDLLGVRDWPNHDGFGPTERAVLAATDESLATGRISDATWAACAEIFEPPELIELVAVIGNWTLFSNLLRTLEVPLEEGVAPWPPDGRAP